MSKAAQGFALRRTDGTPQTETRGERRSSGKGPFMDGNQLFAGRATHNYLWNPECGLGISYRHPLTVFTTCADTKP
ncbi:MAG: hypothetical protein JRF64_07335 [Deltaproteobacteria bacterium]|nr:hypothetical protein [Deltaproteobacteria bacterium]